MEKKTPLYDVHVASKGKIVSFAGYQLPVQYQGVKSEHQAVRNACGMFDVSHMGEIICKEPDALQNLNHLLTNDYNNMADGQARYSPMCNEQGGVVDDLIVYKIRQDCYFLVVNAANKDKDFEWMKAHAFGDAVFTDISDSVGQIALQGPAAETILRKLVSEEQIPKKYYTGKFDAKVNGMDCIISKTGYTGERGYEFYMSAGDAQRFWEMLLEAGAEEGLVPCGLGARDTLRLEAGMPLYGHEMNDEITPLEMGLKAYVKLEKENFIGKQALLEKGEPKIQRIGLKVTGRGIAREHMPVLAEGVKVGETTSGTYCPYLETAMAMALVSKEYAKIGTALEVEIRGKRVEAVVVDLPFYKRK